MGCSGWFRRRPQQRAARALYAPTRAMGQSARPAARPQTHVVARAYGEGRVLYGDA